MISLLPILSKVLEKLLLQKINSNPNTEEWIPLQQFGFRKKHSTIQQIHTISHTIIRALENKKYYIFVFLDVSQAFDRVWYTDLLYKIKKTAFQSRILNIKSYLSDREFRTKMNESTSDNHPIKAGVPQGSIITNYYMCYTQRIYQQMTKPLRAPSPTIQLY